MARVEMDFGANCVPILKIVWPAAGEFKNTTERSTKMTSHPLLFIHIATSLEGPRKFLCVPLFFTGVMPVLYMVTENSFGS